MKRTKDLIEEEHSYHQEQAYLDAEKELHERELMQQLFEEEMIEKQRLKGAQIVLGKGRKASKFATHGRKGKLRFKHHLQYIFRKVQRPS